MGTLREFGLNIAEYAILNSLHYEQNRVERVPKSARALFGAGELMPSLTECSRGMESLNSRRLTQFVDRKVREEIVRDVERFNCLGPTDGIPDVGEFDFTLDGAELWRSLLNQWHTDAPTDFYWHNTLVYIYRRNGLIVRAFDSEWAEVSIHEENFDVIYKSPIGVWRSRWWREIPSGTNYFCVRKSYR